jgi:hypothetical protein
MPYPISNAHTPYDNINGALVNIDNSHPNGIPFSSNVIPTGPHTMAPTGSNVQSAAGIYPCAQNGGKLRGRKINRKKINKISRKYKMKGTKRSIRRRIRKIKSRMRSKHMKSRHSRRHTRKMKGGAHTAMAPNYPAGYLQFDNNKVLSNTYSTGGPLPAASSALASPPPYATLAPEVDNLNHAAPNAYGNYGAGSGFPSRGWF